MERKDGKAVKPERIKYVVLKKVLLCSVLALMLGGCAAVPYAITLGAGMAVCEIDDNCKSFVDQEESNTKKVCHIDQMVRCERVEVEDPSGA